MPILETVLVGAGLGLSLAVPPGPIMAKMAVEVGRGRLGPGIRVGLGATTADLTFFLVFLFLAQRITVPLPLLAGLGLAGVVLLDYLAVQSWQTAQAPAAAPPGRLDGFPAGYLLAATSPLNLAWWTSAGVVFLERYGALLGIGFFAAILAWVVTSAGLFWLGHRYVRSFGGIVAYAGAGLLAFFGVVLAYGAVSFVL